MQFISNIPANERQSFENISFGWFDGFLSSHRFFLNSLKSQHGKTLLLVFLPLSNQNNNPASKILQTETEKRKSFSLINEFYTLFIPVPEKINLLFVQKLIKEALEACPAVRKIIVPDIMDYPEGTLKGSELLSDNGYFYKKNIIVEEIIIPNPVFSAGIISLIKNGNIREANNNLTYPYAISGIVVKGNQIGNTIGFPTANIEPDCKSKVLPALGVYAVKVEIKGQLFPGMLNIGVRPTLNLDTVSIEAHIISFDGNLYHQPITIHFIDRIRDEKRFSGLDALTEQLKADKQEALKIINKDNS